MSPVAEVFRMSAPGYEELAMPLFDSLYHSGDRAEEEDLVQETYLKGLRGLVSFVPGMAARSSACRSHSAKSWFCRM